MKWNEVPAKIIAPMLRAGHVLSTLLLLALAVGGCAVGFGSDPVRPPDAGGDPDVVDETGPDASPDGDDADGGDDPAGEDPVEEELSNPFDPIPAVSEDLRVFVHSIPIVSDPSSFSTPGATRRSTWIGLLDHIMAAEYADAASDARVLGLEIRAVSDTVTGRAFLVVWDTSRGEGIYVFDPSPAHPLVVEVPYPMSDSGTLDEGVEVLRLAGGRALLLPGVTRCTMTATVSCDGTSVACSSAAEAHRASDVAHNPDLIFHLVHRFLETTDTSSVAVQLQGQADSSGAAAIISDGTDIDDVASASVELRDALSASLLADFPYLAASLRSCNDAADAGYTSACNTTNVQGRWSNGITDPCNTAATSASGRFLVMELEASMRDEAVFEEVAAGVASLFD